MRCRWPQVVVPLRWLALAVLVLGLSPTASAQTFSGRVVGISDGDTLSVMQTRVIDQVVAVELEQDMSRRSALQRSPAGRPHRRRNILIGLAIGAAAGGVATVLHCRGKAASCNEVGPAYVLPLTGAGALIGALWPSK